ncbi:hypothetical protein ACFW9F_08170, partial [Streptomyces sp. NPDC059506]
MNALRAAERAADEERGTTTVKATHPRSVTVRASVLAATTTALALGAAPPPPAHGADNPPPAPERPHVG